MLYFELSFFVSVFRADHPFIQEGGSSRDEELAAHYSSML